MAKLYQLASDEASAVALVRLAAKNRMRYELSDANVGILEREISGLYDLPDRDLRSLHEFLKKSDAAQAILGDYMPYLDSLEGEERSELIGYVARELSSIMEEENADLRAKIKPEIVKMVVTNLGMIKITRAGTAHAGYEKKLPPVHLLKVNPGLWRGIVKRSMLENIQRTPIESQASFALMRSGIDDIVNKLLGEVRMENGTK